MLELNSHPILSLKVVYLLKHEKTNLMKTQVKKMLETVALMPTSILLKIDFWLLLLLSPMTLFQLT